MNEIGQFFAPHINRFLTHHERNGVHQVRFATAVWSNNCRKREKRTDQFHIFVRLKILQRNTLQLPPFFHLIQVNQLIRKLKNRNLITQNTLLRAMRVKKHVSFIKRVCFRNGFRCCVKGNQINKIRKYILKKCYQP